MLPSWYEILPTGAELQRKCQNLSEIDSPHVVRDTPFHLTTSIETFLDDTSEMELDGSFLTYSDMDMSTDRLDKHHQVAANTTFISPPDLNRHRKICPKFESTRFLPFEPMFSKTDPYNDGSVKVSGCRSPLSISSWELETESDDLVAPPNSPNIDEHEPLQGGVITKPIHHYAVNCRESNVRSVYPYSGSSNSCVILTNAKSVEYDNNNLKKVKDTTRSQAVELLGERLPCDGMESSMGLVQAPVVLLCATVKPLPQQNVHSHKIVGSAVTKSKNLDIGIGRSQGAARTTKTEQTRHHVAHRLLTTAVVKCSLVSLPSNMDSDDDVGLGPRHVANARCDRPTRAAKKSKLFLRSAASSQKHSLQNTSEKRLPNPVTGPHSTVKQMDTRQSMHDNAVSTNDLFFLTPKDKLSCSISSDATCFMTQPMCRCSVTTRGLYMSQTRQSVLSRKLKQIGRYLHRGKGVRRMHMIPELQTLGVV